MVLDRRLFLKTTLPPTIPLFFQGCAELERGNHVLATTTLVADLALNLLPAEVPVRLLMGPGIDPHTYEPTAGTIASIRKARLILGHGLHLEGRLTELLDTPGSASVLKVSLVGHTLEKKHPDKLRKADEAWDPHVWFDASLWAETIPDLTENLAAVFPEHSIQIKERGFCYREELRKLHAEMVSGYGQIPPGKRVLITSHDAFAYLGRTYGLEVHAIQGISTAAEVSESSLRDLAKLAAERDIRVGFLETTVSPRTLEKLRTLIRASKPDGGPAVFGLGGELYSDSLGGTGSGAESYPGMMRHNLRVIQGALIHG